MPASAGFSETYRRNGLLNMLIIAFAKSVGDGVSELKIDFGPGYRVYYAMSEKSVVLLLIGGDKSTQSKDIETVKRYWQDYQAR